MSKDNYLILFFPNTNEGLDRITPPLNLLAIASVLERDGIAFQIIDGRIEKDYKQKILNMIDNGAKAIGMGVQTGPQIGFALDVCKAIKEKKSEFPVIWGGWHSSIIPEQTVSHPCVDYVIVGQGENTMLDLWNCLMNNGEISSVNGIAYKRDGVPVLNAPRELVSLEEFPPLPIHLIDLSKYPGRKTGPNKVFITYRTSQGCPWRCGYCADPLVFNRRWKGLSSVRIVDELQYIHEKYGVNEVLFVDDTFIVSPKRVRDMCEEMVKRSLRIEWQACARTGMVAKMKQEDLNLMAAAGCVQIHPGVEASSQEMLDHIDKDEKNENTYICAEKLAKAGIRGLYSFMVFYPNEPKGLTQKTIQTIARLKKIDPNNICPVNFFIPFPGNPLFEEAVRKGLKRPESLEDWLFFNTRSGDATPWTKPKDKDFILKMDKYYLPAAFPSESLKMKISHGKFRLVYLFFHKMAKFRVNSENFKFCWDWNLLYAYWKFWEKFNRKFPLHNIHFR